VYEIYEGSLSYRRTTIGGVEGNAIYKGRLITGRTQVATIRGDTVVVDHGWSEVTARLAKTTFGEYTQVWGVYVSGRGGGELVGFGWAGGIYRAGGAFGFGDQVGSGDDSCPAKSLAAVGFALGLFD
jgi:hypothetical protein